MRTKIILVVLDGCRPDALAQAHTPHLDRLWQTGAYTWHARSVAPSLSLPTHTSMFRGVSPQRHGVADNTFNPTAARFPSVLELAGRAGLRTAMFYSWEELRDLAAPGSLALSYCRALNSHEDTDRIVARAAAEHIVAAQPDLTFLYLGSVDLIGHADGWMSAPYIRGIENLDGAVGDVVAALEGAGLRDAFTFLALADHGGHDHEHGSDRPDDLTIPWVLNGPGVRQGYAIQTPVIIMDTAATIAHLLELPRPDVWEGRPVLDALHG